jgi:hypothetical protein
MWDQEKKHLEVMDKLQLQHQVRPTILLEVAKVAGFGLGAATALMGREAAMACTEAVETVIGEHYDEYVGPLSCYFVDILPVNYERWRICPQAIPALRCSKQSYRSSGTMNWNTSMSLSTTIRSVHRLMLF